MGEIVIRELRADDYDALIALWEEAGLSYRPQGRDRRDKIIRELLQPTAIFVVAELNGKIVGSALGTQDGRKGWINRVAVSPGLRQQGIAKEMIAEVERRLGKLGIDIIACLIENWNKTSMEVFQRLGYQQDPEILYFSKRKSPET